MHALSWWWSGKSSRQVGHVICALVSFLRTQDLGHAHNLDKTADDYWEEKHAVYVPR